jgi:hypothetical protein
VATDLSKFSDGDLQKIAAQAKPAAGKYDSYSDEDLMKIAGSKPDPYSKLGSAGMGAAQGITLGYAPQIYGGLAKLAGRDYEKARDSAAAEFSKAQNDNPWSYGAGGVAGSLPLLATGVGEAGEAASIGSAALRAGKTAGLIGLVQNPGESKTGDSLQIGERINNGITGLGLGALAGAGGKYLTNAAETTDLASRLRSTPQAVRDMLRSKLAGAASGIQEKVIDPSMKSAQEALSGVNLPYNTNRILSFEEKAIHPVTGAVQKIKAFPDVVPTGSAEDIQIPGSKALEIRQKLDDLSKWSARPSVSDESKAGNELAEGLANDLRERIRVASPDAATSLNRASEGINAQRDINDMVRDPITKFSSRYGGEHGGDIAPRLGLADEMAGTDLLKTAKTVGKAVHLNSPLPSDVTRVPGWITSQVATKAPGIMANAAMQPIPYIGGRVPYSKLMQSLIAERLRALGQK